ncbi:MAG: histidine--tRNA ligase [Magnetospiraceae bacterium]
MAALQSVKGTRDLLPEDAARNRLVEQTAYRIARHHGFGEISTPILEMTQVFKRTLGETSDVVTKEMYTFEDLDGESLTLRPENTAGVARAFISNGLTQALPLKLFYAGPMFRREKAQKGRYRQFTQIGVEVLGVPGPQADIEVLLLGWDIITALGLADSVTLEINTLGDTESRNAYRSVLVDYLAGHKDALSEISRDRLSRNPLRVLDSKEPEDQAIIAAAPAMGDHMTDAARAFFDTVLEGLTRHGVGYTLNPKLVRGLDYYGHTAFEFTTDRLGAQGTVMAGGRYDGLVKQMGGPPTPGVGWAAGVERLALMLEDAEAALPRAITIIPVGGDTQDLAMTTAHQLRRAGLIVDMGYSGNLTKRLKRANKAHARAAVILGSEEVAEQAATVRDLDSGAEARVKLTDLEAHLQQFRP